MYDYRGELTQELLTKAELQAKFTRFQEAVREAIVADWGDSYEDFDVEDYMVDITHGGFDFDVLVSGQPQALDSILDRLDEAYSIVNSSYHDFDELYGELDEWDTRAAENFRGYYMGRFAEVNLNHLEIIKELIGITAGYREVMARGRQDAAAILDSGIEAAENFEASNGSSSWNTFFRTVGVAAGVASAVALGLPTGGASVAATATIAGGLAGLGEAVTASDGGQETRQYEEAGPILADVMYALQELRGRMVSEANDILPVLQDDIAEVGDGTELVVQRPDVADLPDGQLMEQFPYHGDLTQMSVNLYQLWRAGKMRLPLVAVSYAEAAKELNHTRFSRPWALSSAEFVGDGVAEQWSELFDTLQLRLGETRDDLVDTGEALCEIAEAYARADAAGAEYIHEGAGSLSEDLLLQIQESTENGNLDEIPSSVPEAPGPDSGLSSVYTPGGYY